MLAKFYSSSLPPPDGHSTPPPWVYPSPNCHPATSWPTSSSPKAQTQAGKTEYKLTSQES